MGKPLEKSNFINTQFNELALALQKLQLFNVLTLIALETFFQVKNYFIEFTFKFLAHFVLFISVYSLDLDSDAIIDALKVF